MRNSIPIVSYFSIVLFILNYRCYRFLGDDLVFFVFDGDVITGVFAADDLLADLQHMRAYFSVLHHFSVADGDHFEDLRSLFISAGQDDAGLRLFFGFHAFEDDASIDGNKLTHRTKIKDRSAKPIVI